MAETEQRPVLDSERAVRLLDGDAVFLVEVLDRLVKDADERIAVIAELFKIAAESLHGSLALIPYGLAALSGELDVDLAPVLVVSGTRDIAPLLERADDLGDAWPG